MAESKTYPLAIIAGPCVIESEALCLEIAEEFYRIAVRTGILPIFKASFDKANRTSVDSFRGPGLEEGLRILGESAQRDRTSRFDGHSLAAAQAAPVAEVADILQIPAFLCRQTDLLVAAGKTGKPLNIKKGQFLAPDDMRHAIAKVESTGNHKIFLTERGTNHGYHDLVVDMRALVQLAATGYPVIYDATHSVQRLGGAGGTSGGAPEFIEPLACAAVATGAVSAVFVETHPRVNEARFDRASMLPLALLEGLIVRLVRIAEALDSRTAAKNLAEKLG